MKEINWNELLEREARKKLAWDKIDNVIKNENDSDNIKSLETVKQLLGMERHVVSDFEKFAQDELKKRMEALDN